MVYHWLFLIIALVLTTIVVVGDVSSISALSPTVTRSEIEDEISDLAQSEGLTEVDIEKDLSLENEMFAANNSVDIRSVYYSSDGEILDSLIWLKSFDMTPEFDKLFEFANRFEMRYGVLIDDVSNNRPISASFDYDISVNCICDPKNQNWTMSYSQLTNNNSNIRILGVDYNIKQSLSKELISQSEEDEKYISLPVNLSLLGYPETYRAIYYSMYSFSFNPQIVVSDVSSLITVPPSSISLTLIPPALEVRQGEKANTIVQVNSSNQLHPLLHLSADETRNDIDTTFSRADMNVPSYGFDRTSLTIEALPHAELGSYPILVSANTTSLSSEPVVTSELITANLTAADEIQSEDVMSQAILLVDLKKELSPTEQINKAWHEWGEAVSGFNALILALLAGLSPFFIDRIRRKLKNPQ